MFNYPGWMCSTTKVRALAASRQGVFPQAEVDIAHELARVATEGLREFGRARSNAGTLAEQLAEQLALVHSTFMNIHRGGIILDSDVATSVLELDEALRQQSTKEAQELPSHAVDDLRRLQSHMYDLAILACSRYLDQGLFLNDIGMSDLLICRLEAAFSIPRLSDDRLWSRLCHSKGKIFNAASPRCSRRPGPLKNVADSKASAAARVSDCIVETAAPLPMEAVAVFISDSTGSTTDDCSRHSRWTPVLGVVSEHIDPQTVPTVFGAAGSTGSTLPGLSSSEPARIDLMLCASLSSQIADVLKRHGIFDNTAIVDDILNCLNQRMLCCGRGIASQCGWMPAGGQPMLG